MTKGQPNRCANINRAEKSVNASVREVHGVKGHVFDTIIELDPHTPAAESWLDTFRSFVVHMPNTNVCCLKTRRFLVNQFPAIEGKITFHVQEGAVGLEA